MTYEAILARLEGVRSRGPGKASALCPAHQDRSPSLSVAEGRIGILLRCFAECDKPAIVAAMGLKMADLFFDVPTCRGQRPIPKPKMIDLIALAFRFELAALDRRLRAERIFSSARKVTPDQLSDDDLDHALGLIERAHKDITKAELLEGVADDLRMKEFLERDHEQQRRIA